MALPDQPAELQADNIVIYHAQLNGSNECDHRLWGHSTGMECRNDPLGLLSDKNLGACCGV